ncbi:single-stranded-DNA-specific exonuclease RecJ [Aquirhabdus parva]|uniref:Single-stranded-DNA-specific exonuclease RecJ n=1 Tax=Aquirhabdus parva TaxID=2283318 RepID=A0A345P3I1_9GAMM|nr:single-stranded-DNA-specific exonuclease RecJ [Aquirhabdus parva]AXI01840.1 single-stranded-DNA-specific exonuclease RecJ [Aquirhabdus parva]
MTLSLILKKRPLPPIPSSFINLPQVLARLYASRGVQHIDELELKLSRLLPAQDLLGLDSAITQINAAIDAKQRILIIGDFDADGATSTALMMLALGKMGAVVDFLVPDRFKYGYGLTPEIVALALAEYTPDLIITVDNGISSHEGVDAAQAANVAVIITDHHLTSKAAPPAQAVVNPNQQGCHFASKALAGVGVAFYVLAALATLRKSQGKPTAKLTDWLDLVALGTVADVAPLDANNRILVSQGLARIKSGQCRLGLLALLEIAKRERRSLTAQDLGFVLGPRINAAGRMDSMRIGIECLLAEDPAVARELAEQLEKLNQNRRTVEAGMKSDALALLAERPLFDESAQQAAPPAIVLYEPSWHQGVIGIVAGRLKEQFNRPSIVFAPSDDTEQMIKGSARSIVGVHIRDAIERVAESHPELISHFGGHAMAAGLTLPAENFAAFSQAFNTVIAEHDPSLFEPVLLTDGELCAEDFSTQLAQQLMEGDPWGQAFPAPVFEGEFEILEQRILKEKHLKLTLRHPQGGGWLDAIAFNIDTNAWPNESARVQMAYQLDINEFRGERRLQLKVSWLEPKA